MRRSWLIGGAVMVAATAAAQQPATTVQQDFEAATALTNEGKDLPAALAAWTALEKRVVTKSRNLALVRVRKASVLLAMNKVDEATEAARQGLAGLPKSDASLNGDRYNALIQIAAIAMRALDYPSAIPPLLEAETLAPTPVEKLAVLRTLLTALTFVDPASAAEASARADQLVASGGDTFAKTLRADLATAQSEMLLNAGKFVEARQRADIAVKLLGDLTTHTDLRDVMARGDYALAALLSGDREAARRYMAYTGAGQLPRGEFNPATAIVLPDCDGEDRLRPSDVAVIEYDVLDDGSVGNVRPIYAAAGGRAAIAFARSARNWVFTPKQLKSMPLFFRSRVRVELRCSTMFRRPSIADQLNGALLAWLKANNAEPVVDEKQTPIAMLVSAKRQLASVEASGIADPVKLLSAMVPVFANPTAPADETARLAKRAWDLARTAGAPPQAQLSIAIAYAFASRTEAWRSSVTRAVLSPLLKDPVFEADAASRSAIRLMIADRLGRSNASEGQSLLRAIVAEPTLAANDPLRVGALVRIASMEADSGSITKAREAFELSGLGASQCSLLDAPPKLLRSAGDFPKEALSWGFEGWATLQYDVDATGTPTNTRPVIAYPPFVFSEAAVKAVDGYRFAKTYRPDGGLGCGGLQHRIRFSIL